MPKSLFYSKVSATETFTTEKYSDTSLVVINVTEVLANDNNPVFTQSGYFANITEEETGGHVVQVKTLTSCFFCCRSACA